MSRQESKLVESSCLWTSTRQGLVRTFQSTIVGRTKDYSPRIVKGGLLADCMGLGKSLSALSLICKNRIKGASNSPKTTLIVCPLSSKYLTSSSPSIDRRKQISEFFLTALIVILGWEKQIEQWVYGLYLMWFDL